MPNNQIQMTEPAPMIWVNLVKPRPGNSKRKPRFETTFLLKVGHNDLARIEQEVFNLAREKLGRIEGISIPLARGDRLADEAKAKGKDREFLRGFVRLSCHSVAEKIDGSPLMPPRLKVVVNGKVVDYTDNRVLAQPALYSGVLAIGTISFVHYEGMGGGVSCYVNEVLSLNQGDRIQTGISDEEKYAEVIGKHIGNVSAVDPTAGMSEIDRRFAGAPQY